MNGLLKRDQKQQEASRIRIAKESSENLYKDAWRRFKKSKINLLALALLILIILLAVFGPMITPYRPDQQDIFNKFAPSSWAHPLGTDHLGRDILTRILYGARISLSVGVVAELIATVIGVVLGAAAGFYGGWIDAVISRIIEVFASFPFILFAIAMTFVLGPGAINCFIAIDIIGWTGMARLVRAEVMRLKEQEFTEAARANGSGNARIIFRHLVPNTLPIILVILTMDIPGDIMLESTLSYLGLGVQPPTPSWGEMISAARIYLRQNPMLSVWPGIAIMITVLSFNMLGDGLRDALDPKLRK